MTLLWFLLLVVLLTAVHELGHFAIARAFDVRVLRVSIGFGPTLFTLKRRNTEYCLSAIPLGGYVRLLGEDRREAVSTTDRPQAFYAKPAWQRLLIIFAGPAANLIFPTLIFIALEANRSVALAPVLGSVFAGQPAADADLRPGDRVVAVDGDSVRYWDDLNERILRSPGKELRVTIERSGVDHTITKVLTPRMHRRRDALGGDDLVGLVGIAPHARLAQVGVLDANSPAGRAGLSSFDVVTSIQGRPITNASELTPLTAPRSGDRLLITYLHPRGQKHGALSIEELEPKSALIVPDGVSRTVAGTGGYDSGVRTADLFVYSVDASSPAERLGLARGDQLVSLDGAALASWETFAQALEEHPDRDHMLSWRSRSAPATERSASFRLERRRSSDEYHSDVVLFAFGAEGPRAVVSPPLVPLQRAPLASVWHGLARALSATATMTRVLFATLVGRVPSSTLGGPILLYQVAGVAAERGATQYLRMAALVSLNLGLLNLLPVPLLDGGQASLVLIERIRKRPVSAETLRRAAFVGVVLLIALMLLASSNDLARFLLQ